jgi:hypothetical protein
MAQHGYAPHGAPPSREAVREALTRSAKELAAIDEELALRRKRELRAWEDEEPALQVRNAYLSIPARWSWLETPARHDFVRFAAFIFVIASQICAGVRDCYGPDS